MRLPPAEVCARLGIPFAGSATTTIQGKKYDTPWDGEKMNGRTETGRRQKYADLYHDIGHWLVANPERRTHSGFGLGPSYDYCPGKLLVTGEESVREEVRASAVGILLHAAVADPRGSWTHAANHCWFDHSSPGEDVWSLLQKGCPEGARSALAAVGIDLPREKPSNWRSR